MTGARPIRAHVGTPEFLAIVAAAVPPLPGHRHHRPMCAAWDDHTRRELEQLVRDHFPTDRAGDQR